jgi:TorA maturation chaperone TorD
MSETPTSTELSAIHFSAPDEGEELARAEVYGLLASLFIAPVTRDLRAQLQVAVTQAPTAGGFLEHAWSQFVAVSRRLSLADVQAEHEALFGGVGKPEVALYGSWYQSGHLNDAPLAALRHALAELGLERPAGVVETEDHVACLCEVMRYLIAGDDLAVCNLARQQAFFNAHLRSWTDLLCDTLVQHPRADFFAALANFARDFWAVEAQGFDLLET